MTTITPYRSPVQDGRDGFGQLLHAEWTKFRTVRGWIIGMIVAILVTAGIGLFLVAASANVSCGASSPGGPVQHLRHGRRPAARPLSCWARAASR